jgi:hypothetical protein
LVSASVPPDAAFGELERLVRHLGEELAFFRRRALEAERRWRDAAELNAQGDAGPSRETLIGRVAELERENGDLRARLDDAAERTRQMADRLRFLRQQEDVRNER